MTSKYLKATSIKSKTRREKIKRGLDGRKQRWLALELGISDTQLSNKMNGITPFSDDEVKKIESLLDIVLSDN